MPKGFLFTVTSSSATVSVNDTAASEAGENSSIGPTLPSPEIILGKKLGAGAFGTVYLAAFKGQEVAVKTVSVNDAKKGKNEAYLKEEARLLARMKHPHIIQFIDFIQNPGVVVLIMEFVKGDNLYDIMKKNKVFQPLIQLGIAKDLTAAIAYLHSKGIIHRDIKPENVLVEKRDGHIKSAKLADFGLAMELEKGKYALPTVRVGTAGYYSPQIFLSHCYNHSADIFSLGMVMWEIYANKLITSWRFVSDKDDVEGFYDAIMNDNRPRMNDYMPDTIKDLIRGAWATAAEDRPSAEEMLKELEKIFQETSKRYLSLRCGPSLREPSPIAALARYDSALPSSPEEVSRQPSPASPKSPGLFSPSRQSSLALVTEGKATTAAVKSPWEEVVAQGQLSGSEEDTYCCGLFKLK
jgi:serine/threonine protein kinase